jgi:uncharacterized protein (DUF1778 family)
MITPWLAVPPALQEQKMSEKMSKHGSISVRCDKAQQERIDTAAALTGVARNQFVFQAVLEKTDRVIGQERRISATAADLGMIMEQLENPPVPNRQLATMLAQYHEKVDNGTLATNASKPVTRDR